MELKDGVRWYVYTLAPFTHNYITCWPRGLFHKICYLIAPEVSHPKRNSLNQNSITTKNPYASSVTKKDSKLIKLVK